MSKLITINSVKKIMKGMVKQLRSEFEAKVEKITANEVNSMIDDVFKLNAIIK